MRPRGSKTVAPVTDAFPAQAKDALDYRGARQLPQSNGHLRWRSKGLENGPCGVAKSAGKAAHFVHRETDWLRSDTWALKVRRRVSVVMLAPLAPLNVTSLDACGRQFVAQMALTFSIRRWTALRVCLSSHCRTLTAANLSETARCCLLVPISMRGAGKCADVSIRSAASFHRNGSVENELALAFQAPWLCWRRVQ